MLITNIKTLVNTRTTNQLVRGSDLNNLPCIEDAFLHIEHGKIVAFGAMKNMPANLLTASADVFDATGRFILPCWVDSHSHVVFAGTRENEFIDKLNGLSYADIAAKGGGILNSAKKLESTPHQQLYNQSLQRINDLVKLGTGALEIKSGYGLSPSAELKMLRVIKQLKETCSIPIKATFLGAHAYPLAYKNDHQGYIDLIINDMLPAIAAEDLADFVDVFCEAGFFSATELLMICTAAAKFGLRPKLHVNQLSSMGGIQAGIKANALSLDHLETLTFDEIELLGKYNGISTLLPTAAFFLRMPYQPARQLVNANAAVALASDFNPGSSPGGNMNFVTALSCIQMKMLPNEVINAATINGAFAMDVQNEVGSIMVGKRANVIITNVLPSIDYMFYSFSTNHIYKVLINGNWQ